MFDVEGDKAVDPNGFPMALFQHYLEITKTKLIRIFMPIGSL